MLLSVLFLVAYHAEGSSSFRIRVIEFTVSLIGKHLYLLLYLCLLLSFCSSISMLL